MQRCRSSRAATEQQRRHGKSCSSSFVRLCLSKMGKATSSWFPPFSSASSSSSSACLFSAPAAEAEATAAAGATAAAAAAKRKAWSGGGCSSAGAATAAAAAAECDEEKSGKLMLSNPRVSRRSLLFKFLTMAFLFLLAVAGLVNFYFHLPGLSGKKRAELAQLLPSSWRESGKLRQLETVRAVFRVFAEYKAMHPWSTWLFLCCCYLLYQAFPFFTFTFPGTATVVTLLLGALYPAHVAFITANALAAIGPSAAYFIIWFVGKPLVSFMFADKLEKLSRLLRAKGRTRQQRQQKSSSSSNGWSTNSRSVTSNGGCASRDDVCGAVRISSGAEEDISIRGREGEAAAARCGSNSRRGGRGLKRSSSRSRSCTSSSSGSSIRSNGSRRSSVRSRSSKGRISRRSTRRDSSGGSSNPHQVLHTEGSCLRPRLEERGRHGEEKEFERGGKRQQRSVVTAEVKRGDKEKQEEDAAVEAATAAVAAPLLPRLLKEGDKNNKKQREKEQQPKRESKSRPLQMEPRKSSKRFDVDLFLTMLFLRVSPVFPNLVITAAAPLLGVPFDVFFYATLLGLMPNTAVFVSMGSTLSSLDSLYGSWKLWGLLCVMGGAVLLLKIMRQRLGAMERAALEAKGDEEMQEES